MHPEREPVAGLVSVIIPCYNAASFVAEAIESVLAQSYPDWEIVVVDDGSPDRGDLDRALAPYLERIRLVRQENQGLAGARNSGISAARGEFLAFLDADDMWEPGYLETQLGCFQRDPELDLVYCDAWLFGSSAVAGLRAMALSPSHGPVTLASVLREECVVLVSCAVARREAVVAAGGFDAFFRRSEDFDLWIRMLSRGARFAYHTAPLARRRIHPNSLSADMEAMFRAATAVLEKALGADPDDVTRGIIRARIRAISRRHAIERSRAAILSGDFARARDCLDEAIGNGPAVKLLAARFGLTVAPRLVQSFALRSQRSKHDPHGANG